MMEKLNLDGSKNQITEIVSLKHRALAEIEKKSSKQTLWERNVFK